VRALALLGVSAVIALAPARSADASLASTLNRFVLANATIFATPGGAVPDTLSPLISRLAQRGTSLPATSTLPGVTYEPLIEEGAFAPTPGPLGSPLLERAETVGRGRFAFDVDYLYADLTQFDGHELGPQIDYASGPFQFGQDLRVRTRLDFQSLTVRTHQLSLSGTYGVTDGVDVNLLVPFVRTSLDVRARRRGFVNEALRDDTIVSAHDDATGIGDLLVRAKCRLPSVATLDLAAVLEMRMPTGSEDDFHGLGDWRLTPLLVASRDFGPHEGHLNLGVEVDADDLSRTRARYGVGGSVYVIEPLAMFADVFGSSGLADDEFQVRSGANLASSRFLDQFQSRPPATDARGRVTVFQFIPRTDVVDLAIGLKVNFFYRGSFFITAIVPVVRDALRADVIPAGGIEMNF
jgi:hypothetical protein